MTKEEKPSGKDPDNKISISQTILSGHSVVKGDLSIGQVHLKANPIEKNIKLFPSLSKSFKAFIGTVLLALGTVLIISGFRELQAEGAVYKTRFLLILGSTLIAIICTYDFIILLHQNIYRKTSYEWPIKVPSKKKVLPSSPHSYDTNDFPELAIPELGILDPNDESFDNFLSLKEKHENLSTKCKELIVLCDDFIVKNSNPRTHPKNIKEVIFIRKKCHLIRAECDSFVINKDKDFQKEYFRFKSLESSTTDGNYIGLFKAYKKVEKEINNFKSLEGAYNNLLERCEEIIGLCRDFISDYCLTDESKRYKEKTQKIIDKAKLIRGECQKFSSAQHSNNYNEAYEEFNSLENSDSNGYKKLVKEYKQVINLFASSYNFEKRIKTAKLFMSLIGAVSIPSITYSRFHNWLNAPTEKTILTSANYAYDDPSKPGDNSNVTVGANSVTNLIQTNLEHNISYGDAEAGYNNVDLKRIDKAFLDRDSAIDAGKQKRATLSMWGSYYCVKENGCDGDLWIFNHIELLKRAEPLVNYIENERKILDLNSGTRDLSQYRVYLNNLSIADLSFSDTIESSIDREVSYLINFIAGLAFYKDENWKAAQQRFDTALEHIGENEISSKNELNRELVESFSLKVKKRISALHFYQGNNYLYSSYLSKNEEGYDFAIDSFKKAIEIFESEYSYILLTQDIHTATLINYTPSKQEFVATGETDDEQTIVCENQRSDSKTTIDLSSNDITQLRAYLARVYNNLAVAYAIKGDYVQALVNYQKAHKFDVEVDEICVNLGESYTALGNYELALQNYSQAVAVNQQDIVAHNNLANIYIIQGKYRAAISHYNKAINLKPDSAEFYYNRGRAYLLLDESRYQEKSIKDFEKAVELNPSSASLYYYGRALDYLDVGSKGAFRKAIDCFISIIENNPEFADNVAKEYGNEIHLDSSSFQSSFKLSFATAYFEVAKQYKKNESHKNSLRSLNKAVQLNPDFAEAYNLRAKIHIEQNRYNQAKLDLDRAININPNIAEVYYNRGFYFISQEDHEKAKEDFDNAFKLILGTELDSDQEALHSSQEELLEKIHDAAKLLPALQLDPIIKFENTTNSYEIVVLRKIVDNTLVDIHLPAKGFTYKQMQVGQYILKSHDVSDRQRNDKLTHNKILTIQPNEREHFYLVRSR